MLTATILGLLLLLAGSASAEQDQIVDSWIEEQNRLVRDIAETHLREPPDPSRLTELERRFIVVQAFLLLNGSGEYDVIQVEPERPLAPQLIIELLKRSGIDLPVAAKPVPKPVWRHR